jgi:hypothetical protein
MISGKQGGVTVYSTSVRKILFKYTGGIRSENSFSNLHL